MGNVVDMSEFYARPTIASQFPLNFASGARWTKCTCHCSRCNRPILPNDLRGVVIEIARDVTYREHHADFFFIDALGYCAPCRLLTPMRYGLTEGHLIGQRGKELLVWGPTRPSLRSRLMSWLKRLLTRKKDQP